MIFAELLHTIQIKMLRLMSQKFENPINYHIFLETNR